MRPQRSGLLPAGFAVVAALLLTSPLQALDPSRALTQYFHRIWQTPQGLPRGTVRSIQQSADGFMWIGTDLGLVRFDGLRFSPPSSLPNDLQDARIKQLASEPSGTLWILADTGLFRFNDKTDPKPIRVALNSPDGISFIAAAKDGGIWACSQSGVWKISASGTASRLYGMADGLALQSISAATAKSSGSLWLAGIHQGHPALSRFDGAHFVSEPLPALPTDARIRVMLWSDANTLWLGTTNGVASVHDGQIKRFTPAEGLGGDSVLSLSYGRDGTLWVGTESGFSRIRGGQVETFLQKDGLSQSSVSAVFEDREGSLWAGTKGGLNQFVDRRTIPYTTSEGLPSNNTGPVMQDANGMIWLGTLDAGLAAFHQRHKITLTRRQGLSSDTILSLAASPQGQIWVGTDRGLNLVEDGKVVRTFTPSTGLPPTAVRSLLVDSSGDLWVGSAKGLYIYRGGRFALVENPPASEAVVALAESQHGAIYAAFDGLGVRAYNSDTLAHEPDRDLPLRDADALFVEPSGLLWIGTRSGLRLKTPRELVSFSISNGLYDDEIYGIAGDSRDQLWLASSKGIFSVKGQDLLRVANGHSRQVVSTPFSPLDGLQTLECKSGVQPPVWTMQDGHLTFSTSHGVLALYPKRLDMKLAPPPVAIESVVIDGRRQEPALISKLGPDVKNLEFDYTALSYRSPARITFQYRLEGFESGWTEAGERRQVFYTNLKPGAYRFRVTACNADGTCNNVGTALAFNLVPHFYQRRSFLAACILVPLLLVGFAYVWRIRTLRRHFDIVIAERSRIARELHDTLIQGFSGVTMEMQALLQKLPPAERSTLQEIVLDAGKCMREARRSVANLRSGQRSDSGLAAAVSEAVKGASTNGAPRLELTLDTVPNGLPAFVEYNLVRIAQEAVTNCIKHSGATLVQLRLRLTPEFLVMSVRDNGKGMQDSQTNSHLQNEHFGLIGMNERASDIGADLQIESGSGSGTVISVALPIRQAGKGIKTRFAAARLENGV